jgi:hypothetical protein
MTIGTAMVERTNVWTTAGRRRRNADVAGTRTVTDSVRQSGRVFSSKLAQRPWVFELSAAESVACGVLRGFPTSHILQVES